MFGRTRLAIAGGLFLAVLGGAGFLGVGSCLLPAALANDCAAKCQAQENACRRATKDSPSCSSEMTRCLQGCRAQR